MSTLEQLLKLVGGAAKVATDPDDYGLARWRPGVLPALAERLELAPLLLAKGRRSRLVADLPDWFRFPVNLTTGDVVQPAFDFLKSDVAARGEAARHTTLARAYDLQAFFAFLARCETAWTEVDQGVIDEFALDMVSAAIELGHDPAKIVDDGVGLEGHHDDEDGEDGDFGVEADGGVRRVQSLAQSTVKRRLSTVQCFYRHALSGPIPFDVRNSMKAGRRPEQTVRPIPQKDLLRFVETLGLPPSLRKEGSARLWVASMLALVAGLRRMEVCGLDSDLFDIAVDPDEPEREHCFSLVVAKGGVIRTFVVPTWLLLEIRSYVDGERRAAVAGCADASPSLLLNHVSSHRSPLERLKPETLSYDFRKLMLSTDTKRKQTGFRLGRGVSELPHTFHDLRHTCACMTFVDMKERCADPYLAVQTTLGHRLLDTTKKVYLRYVDEFAGTSSDMRQSLVKAMLTR